MYFEQKRIRSLKGRLGTVRVGSTVVVGAKLVPDLMPKLVRIGFPKDASIGDAVLPAAIGPVTQRNAYGEDIVHKDQPKETAYRTVERHWEEWHGPFTEPNSKLVDVPYKRYPRTQIPPQSIELKIAVTADGQRVLVSPPMKVKIDDDVGILHVINMFLEIIGFCEIFDSNLKEIISAPLRRLNWKILPSGHRTWKALRPDVLEIIRRAREGNQPVGWHALRLCEGRGRNA